MLSFIFWFIFSSFYVWGNLKQLLHGQNSLDCNIRHCRLALARDAVGS